MLDTQTPAQDVTVTDADIQWPAPRQSQVEAEVSLLKTLLDRIPPMTFYGHSNLDAIEAQIEVLRLSIPLDEVQEEFEDEDDYVISAAVTAAEWLEGLDPLPPSHGWLGMLGESTARLVN